MSFDAQTLKKHWGFLSQIASIIAGIIGGILIPPSVLEPVISTGRAKGLAIFIVTVVVGLFLLISRRSKGQKAISRWLIATGFFLAFSIASFFIFLKVYADQTCMYAGHKVPIGTVYTAKGSSYVSENPHVNNCETLINDFVGKTNEIWTDESINNWRLILFALYLLTFVLMSLVVLSLIHLLTIRRPAN